MGQAANVAPVMIVERLRERARGTAFESFNQLLDSSLVRDVFFESSAGHDRLL
jgi:hypothetical protein